MKEKVEYYIVLFFIKLVKLQPVSWTFAFFHFFGVVAYYCLSSRRKIAIDNLAYAFADKSEKEIKNLAKENFLNISKTIAEIFLLLSEKKEPKDFIKDEEAAIDHYNQIMKIKEKTQGAIFVTAHFSNWEMISSYFSSKGYAFVVVGRAGNNKLIENRLTRPFRQKYNNENVYKSEAMGKMVRTLKNGEKIGILIDQKAGHTNSAKTTFFNRECMTTISVATMKLKYNPLIIPAFALRQSDGKFSFIVKAPIEYIADEIDIKEEKIKAMTQKYNDALEEVVKEYPTQWFWMHNRWKI